MTFWKRQNYGAVNNSVVAWSSGEEREAKVEHKEFLEQ